MSLNSTHNAAWWDEFYTAHPHGAYGKAPSPFLVDMLPRLKKGPTLDVGCGEGRQSVYLAQKDFEVTGIDFSPVAISRAQALAKDSGVTLTLKTQDLDFFIVPLMAYHTMVVSNLKAPLTTLMTLTRGLAPGGTLLVEAPLLASHTPSLKLASQSPLGYKSNELLGFVKDLQLLFYSELACEGDAPVVRLLARKNIKLG